MVNLTLNNVKKLTKDDDAPLQSTVLQSAI